MDAALAVAGILGGIAALFSICAGLAAAWRWWKPRGQSPTPPAAASPRNTAVTAPPALTPTDLPHVPPRDPDLTGRLIGMGGG